MDDLSSLLSGRLLEPEREPLIVLNVNFFRLAISGLAGFLPVVVTARA